MQVIWLLFVWLMFCMNGLMYVYDVKCVDMISMVIVYSEISVGLCRNMLMLFSEFVFWFGSDGSVVCSNSSVMFVVFVMIRNVMCQLNVLLIMWLSGILVIIVIVEFIVSRLSVWFLWLFGVSCMVSGIEIDQNIVCVYVMLSWLIISIVKFYVMLVMMWLLMNISSVMFNNLWCLMCCVMNVSGNDMIVMVYVQIVSIRLIVVGCICRLLLIVFNSVMGMNLVVLKMKVVRVRVRMFYYDCLELMVFGVVMCGFDEMRVGGVYGVGVVWCGKFGFVWYIVVIVLVVNGVLLFGVVM